MRSAVKSVRTAFRRVVTLAVLWGVLHHQVGIVDGGVLGDPTVRVAEALGAAVGDVVVTATYSAAELGETTAATEDMWRAAEAAVQQLRRKRPDTTSFVEEPKGSATVSIAVMAAGRSFVDGASVAALRRDVAWMLARQLNVPPSAVATEVLVRGHVVTGKSDESDVAEAALTRFGARRAAVDDRTVWRVGDVTVVISTEDARADVVGGAAPGGEAAIDVVGNRLPGSSATMMTIAHIKR